MIAALITYYYAASRIISIREADCSDVQAIKNDMKKLALVALTVGLGWLFVLLAFFESFGQWADWLVIIFKLVQSVSLLNCIF